MTLREAAEKALTLFDEAISYIGTPTWSPSMEDECKAALFSLRAALAQEAQERKPLTDEGIAQATAEFIYTPLGERINIARAVLAKYGIGGGDD